MSIIYGSTQAAEIVKADILQRLKGLSVEELEDCLQAVELRIQEFRRQSLEIKKGIAKREGG